MKASLKRFASVYVSQILGGRCCKEKLTLRVGKSDSKSLSFWLALTDISGGVPNPASVASNVGGELHLWDN